MELVDVRFIGMAPDGRWPLEQQQQQQQKERKIFFGKHLLNFPDPSAAIRDVKKNDRNRRWWNNHQVEKDNQPIQRSGTFTQSPVARYLKNFYRSK